LPNSLYIKLKKEKKIFWMLFFFLGNYFAGISIWFADKAKASLRTNDMNGFCKQMKYARICAYWGLIPSTIINIIILIVAFVLLRTLYFNLSVALGV